MWDLGGRAGGMIYLTSPSPAMGIPGTPNNPLCRHCKPATQRCHGGPYTAALALQRGGTSHLQIMHVPFAKHHPHPHGGPSASESHTPNPTTKAPMKRHVSNQLQGRAGGQRRREVWKWAHPLARFVRKDGFAAPRHFRVMRGGDRIDVRPPRLSVVLCCAVSLTGHCHGGGGFGRCFAGRCSRYPGLVLSLYHTYRRCGRARLGLGVLASAVGKVLW
jgi:hypothetical protein